MKENKSVKQKMITRFALLAFILVLLNIVSSKLHKQFDLTSEKRFSLSTPTKELLKNLNEDVVIEVYLKGSFPAGFQRLQESTREVLQQFKVYGGNHIRFEFINPLKSK